MSVGKVVDALMEILVNDPPTAPASEVGRRNDYLSQFPSMPKALEDAHARFVEGVAKS